MRTARVSKTQGITLALALALMVPMAGAHATATGSEESEQIPEAPQVVEEAFEVGSDVYDEAIALLEEPVTLSTELLNNIDLDENSNVTYGKQHAHAYLRLDPTGTGNLGIVDFDDIGNRYAAIQYVDGVAVGLLVVDEAGEFVEMTSSTEEVLAALENVPDGGTYLTDGAYSQTFWLSPDGSTVRALDDYTRDAIGANEITADELRTFKAKQEEIVTNSPLNQPDTYAGSLGAIYDAETGANETAAAGYGTLSAAAPGMILGVGGLAITGVAGVLLLKGRNREEEVAE